MQKQFDSELLRVKSKYEEAVQKVDAATDKLVDLFKSKVANIKEKSALFFAKMEMKSKEMNDEVLGISQVFRQFQESMMGPNMKFDA